MKAKRILCLAMAMIMTFIVFAIPASAVSGYFLKPIVGVDGGQTTVAAGETVKITFALESEQEYNKWNGGVFSLAWDNTKIDYAGTMTYAGTWATVLDTTMVPNTEASAISDVTWSANDIAKGYNDGFKMVIAETTWDYSLTDGEILLTYDFKVADDVAPGTEIYVGIADGQYAGGEPGFYLTPDSTWGFPILDDESDWNMTDFGMGSYDKSASYVKLTVAAADPEVTHEKFMGRMDNWKDTTATKFDAGFVGKISNLDVEFADDGKQVENITSIVVEITRDGETLTGNAYQIYAQADGSYLFRAVVKNANIADSETVSYKYIVTLSNGEELTAEGTTSFASIYADAKANYDAANA